MGRKESDTAERLTHTHSFYDALSKKINSKFSSFIKIAYLAMVVPSTKKAYFFIDKSLSN